MKRPYRWAMCWQFVTMFSISEGVRRKPGEACEHSGDSASPQRQTARVSLQVPLGKIGGRAVQRWEGLPHQADQGVETHRGCRSSAAGLRFVSSAIFVRSTVPQDRTAERGFFAPFVVFPEASGNESPLWSCTTSKISFVCEPLEPLRQAALEWLPLLLLLLYHHI